MTYRIACRVHGETTWLNSHPKATRFFTAFREAATTYRTRTGAIRALADLVGMYGEFHIVDSNAVAPWERLS